MINGNRGIAAATVRTEEKSRRQKCVTGISRSVAFSPTWRTTLTVTVLIVAMGCVKTAGLDQRDEESQSGDSLVVNSTTWANSVYMWNPATNFCLVASRKFDKANINACDDEDNRYRWVHNPDNGQILSIAKGKCLEPGELADIGLTQDPDKTWGEKIALLYDCDPTEPKQRWQYDAATAAWRNPETNLCLDSWGTDRTAMVHPCHGQQGNQGWVEVAHPEQSPWGVPSSEIDQVEHELRPHLDDALDLAKAYFNNDALIDSRQDEITYYLLTDNEPPAGSLHQIVYDAPESTTMTVQDVSAASAGAFHGRQNQGLPGNNMFAQVNGCIMPRITFSLEVIDVLLRTIAGSIFVNNFLVNYGVEVQSILGQQASGYENMFQMIRAIDRLTLSQAAVQNIGNWVKVISWTIRIDGFANLAARAIKNELFGNAWKIFKTTVLFLGTIAAFLNGFEELKAIVNAANIIRDLVDIADVAIHGLPPCPPWWIESAEGQSCTDACNGIDDRCAQDQLTAVRTSADINDAAELVGTQCNGTQAWSYSANPGRCTNARCCEGGCVGVCAYGIASPPTCDAVHVDYTRFCPCVR